MRRSLIIGFLMFVCANVYAQDWFSQAINGASHEARMSAMKIFDEQILPDKAERENFLQELTEAPDKSEVFKFFMSLMEDYSDKEKYSIGKQEYYKFVKSIISMFGMREYYDKMLISAASAGELYSFQILMSRIWNISDEVKKEAITGLNNRTKTASPLSDYMKGCDKILGYLEGQISLGHEQILENMKKAVATLSTLEEAIKDNPDVYCEENFLDLVQAAKKAKTSAEAEDLLTKAQLIQSISGVASFLSLTDKELTERLFNIFFERLDQKQLIDRVKYVGKDMSRDEVIWGTILFYLSGSSGNNGMLTNALDTAIVFGTPENEFKDGLFYITSQNKYTSKETKAYLRVLKVLILCNNQFIINSNGEERDIVDFLTQDYAIVDANGVQKSIAMARYAFGLLDERSFDIEKFSIIEEGDLQSVVKLEDISTMKLNKGLELFKNIRTLSKTGL